MAFQLGEDHDVGMNEMNLIPLIDIMLVLMIIFLVTAAVANPSIPLTLPKTTAELSAPPPKAITISVAKDGHIAWNTETVSLDELSQRLQEAGKEPQKPTVQLRADKDARYDSVAQVMSRASDAGLGDLSFLTDQ